MNENDLTERQIRLLKAVIQEFMDTAEAVGSIHLPIKYNLGVSPATIRNEMMHLAEMGLLQKSHVSSGRVPTARGYKFFIDELLENEDEIQLEDEVQVREGLFQERFNVDRLLYMAVRKLVDFTHNMSFGIIDGRLHYHGVTNLLEYPEYNGTLALKNLMLMLENPDYLIKLFDGVVNEHKDIYVLIGKEDIGKDSLEKEAIIFGKLNMFRGQSGYVGIVGPSRLNYSQSIPAVKWIVNTINKSISGWN